MTEKTLEQKIDTKDAQRVLEQVTEAARAQFAICRAGDVVMIEYDRVMTVETHAQISAALAKSLDGTAVRCLVLSKGMRVARSTAEASRNVPIPGLPGRFCTVGETPALGYTVGELIDRLSQYPRDAPVGMNVGPGSNLEILSLYRATEKPQAIWFDLGEEGDE